MIEMYKIMTGKYDRDVTDFIRMSHSETRGHKYKIYKGQNRRSEQFFCPTQHQPMEQLTRNSSGGT